MLTQSVCCGIVFLGPRQNHPSPQGMDAVELEDNRDGVIHVVQARLARKTLVKLRDQGFVKYTVVLPSSCHNRGSRLPPGTDSDWLLCLQDSEHSYYGYHTRELQLTQSPG